MFSCDFCEISKTTFIYRTPPVAASVDVIFRGYIYVYCLLCIVLILFSLYKNYLYTQKTWYKNSTMTQSKKYASREVLHFLKSFIKSNNIYTRQLDFPTFILSLCCYCGDNVKRRLF